MPRVSIYADRAPIRDAMARLFDEIDDVEVADVAARPPWRAGESPDDVVVLDLGLRVADRLEVLGQAWRSLHPPRIVFLTCESGRDGVDAGIDPDNEETLRATIREILDGERDSARLTVRLGRAGPVSGGCLPAGSGPVARPA